MPNPVKVKIFRFSESDDRQKGVDAGIGYDESIINAWLNTNGITSQRLIGSTFFTSPLLGAGGFSNIAVIIYS